MNHEEYTPFFSLTPEGYKVKLIPVSCVTCSEDNFADLTSDTAARALDSSAFANHHRKVWSFAFSQNLPANKKNEIPSLITLTHRNINFKLPQTKYT